jgi:hypothetical protein
VLDEDTITDVRIDRLLIRYADAINHVTYARGVRRVGLREVRVVIAIQNPEDDSVLTTLNVRR